MKKAFIFRRITLGALLFLTGCSTFKSEESRDYSLCGRSKRDFQEQSSYYRRPVTREMVRFTCLADKTMTLEKAKDLFGSDMNLDIQNKDEKRKTFEHAAFLDDQKNIPVNLIFNEFGRLVAFSGKFGGKKDIRMTPVALYRDLLTKKESSFMNEYSDHVKKYASDQVYMEQSTSEFVANFRTRRWHNKPRVWKKK